MECDLFTRQPSVGATTRSHTAPLPSIRRPLGRIRPALPGSLEDSERCGVCCKEDFWLIHDGFEAMDRRGTGAIRRSDYLWALRAHGTSLEFHKTARRAGLNAYFRGSSEELPLEAFVRRVFLSIGVEDVKLIVRWAALRKARGVLTKPDFKATDEELLEVFGHLDESGSSELSLSELVRSDILERDEVYRLIPSGQRSSSLNFDEFCRVFRSLIAKKYVDPDRTAPADEALARERLRETAVDLRKRFQRCARRSLPRRSTRVVHQPVGPMPLGLPSPVRRRALRRGTTALPAAAAAAAARTRDESKERQAPLFPCTLQVSASPRVQQCPGIAAFEPCGRKGQLSISCVSEDSVCRSETTLAWRTHAACVSTICAF